jgi:enoyl-CoA hydratase/carnithine racemase
MTTPHATHIAPETLAAQTTEKSTTGQREQLSDTVRLDINEGIATVWLTRADKHNAVTEQTLHGIEKAQKRIRKDRSIRAVIIAGEGDSFCSGLDFPSLLKRPLLAARLYLQLFLPYANLFQRWSMGWRKLDVPVIAAIEGHCYGAGIQLALGADFRIAHPDSQMSVMEIRWGLIPDMGGPTLLRELLRIDVAKDLMMTGRVLSATQAAELGLITRLDDNPLAAAREQAKSLVAQPRNALAQAKQLVQRAWGASEYASLRLERIAQLAIMAKAEQRDVVQSRMRKRKSKA